MPRPKKEQPNRADSRYEIKITIGKDFNNKPIRKSFYSTISKEDARAQAENWRIEQKASEMAGVAFVDKSITFEGWAKIWLLKYKKGTVKGNTYEQSYLKVVENYLNPYFGKSLLVNIKPVDVTDFFNKNAKYSQDTLDKMRICLNAIFETAIDNDLCYKNPVKRIKAVSNYISKKKETYSTQERDELLKLSCQYEDGIILYLLLELGLRCSELCGLKWEDFDFSEKTVHIQRASVIVGRVATIGEVKSKTSDRILPISNDFAELAEVQTANGLIFINAKGKPYTAKTFPKARYNVLFNKIKETHPNVKRLNMHELRHTCGTLLYDKTKDIYAVSKFMGHSSVKVTEQYYVHEDVDMLRKHLNVK